MDDDLDVALGLLGLVGQADDGGDDDAPEGDLAVVAGVLALPAPRTAYEQRSLPLMQQAGDVRALQRAEAQNLEKEREL